MRSNLTIILATVATLFVLSRSAGEPPQVVPLSCPQGSTKENTRRSFSQIQTKDFNSPLNGYTKQLIKVIKSNIYNPYDYKNEAVIFYFKLKSTTPGDTSEKIYGQAIYPGGETGQGIVAESLTGLQNIIAYSDKIFCQGDTNDDGTSQLFQGFFTQSFKYGGVYSYLSDFKINGTADPSAGSWDLVDSSCGSDDQCGVNLVMKKSESQYYVGQKQSSQLNGYMVSTKSPSELYCTTHEFCFDLINKDFYVEGVLSNDLATLDNTADIKFLGMVFATTYNSFAVLDNSIVTQIKGTASTTFVFDRTPALIVTWTHSFTNSAIQVFSTHYNGDYLQYDGESFFYLYLSLGLNQYQYKHDYIVINRVILDSTFPDIQAIIQSNGVQMFSFTPYHLYMMSEGKVTIVKKSVHATKDPQYHQVGAFEGFELQAELDLSSSLVSWLDNVDTDLYLANVQCQCYSKVVGHMECFENSVCIFVAVNGWSQC